MKLYKIKHIPTGLFYIPSRGSGNLSIKGKIYVDRIPSLDWCKTIRIQKWSSNTKLFKILTKYFDLPENGYVNEYFKTKQTDWEIIEVE